MADFIAYYRVSTDRQGVSGLGLEAQRMAVASFIADKGQVIGDFTEVESGGKNKRPQLLAAIDQCRSRRATLIIAKLDRLSRDVHFISGLMKSEIKFVAVDIPHADTFQLHVLAAVAEHEARMISQRTKAALAAARARGVKLGGDRGYRPDAAKMRREAEERAKKTLALIDGFKSHGITSKRDLVVALNAHAHPAPRGGRWRLRQLNHLLQTYRHTTVDQSSCVDDVAGDASLPQQRRATPRQQSRA
ncbi:MAG: recombinase family protein [Hyphomicrobiaceae bacterium]|nr:MAG: recombinase family protein [Hyphomicrobiaceae bacterium]